MIDEVLYSSNRDESPEPVEQKMFEPEEAIEYTIAAPITTAAPEYSPSSNLVTTKTVIPTSIQYIPDLTKQSSEPILRLDIEKLAAQYAEPIATRIIDNLQNDISLPPNLAERLIQKGIIIEALPAETVPFVPEVLTSGDPMVNKPTTPEPKPESKKSFIDKLTNTLYNLIFN